MHIIIRRTSQLLQSQSMNKVILYRLGYIVLKKE